jgi:uncharacterized protein (DUF2141 family)
MAFSFCDTNLMLLFNSRNDQGINIVWVDQKSNNISTMKTLLLIIFLSTTLVKVSYCQQASLEVTIKNIKNKKGSIRIGLFTNDTDFMKKIAYGKIVKVDGAEVTAVFDDLPAGDYGISIIHDENENGELDTNKMGIPKEGFAFGNNAMGKMGPASFENSKVAVREKSVHQVLNLKYF